MRIRLLIVLLLVGFIGNSQIRYLHPWYHFENKVTVNDLFADSVFYAPLIDTGTYTPSRIGAITIHNTGSAYIWDGTAWVILAGAADGNNYPSDLTFSGGILTVPRNGLSDLTATIDGRYLKISDTSGIWLTETSANNLYASSTHSHLASDISDFVTATRSLFTEGTGITITDGVISWSGASSGITSLNGLEGTTQTFTEGYGQTISSAGTAHTFSVDTNLITSSLRTTHVIDSLLAIMQAALDLKLNISDTSDMLGFYYRDVEVAQDSLLIFTKGNGSKDTVSFTPGGSSGSGSESAPSITTSTDDSLTLTNTGSYFKTYVYSGTADATWTLPAIGTTGQRIRIKNISAYELTVQRAGSNNIFTSTTTTSVILLTGDGFEVQDNGTYWLVF